MTLNNLRDASISTFMEMAQQTGSASLPVGRSFSRFPLLTKMTHGLQGIFMIAGAPGVGKSTLTVQLAVDVACADYPCVYYESENRLVVDGKIRSLAVDRAVRVLGGQHEKLQYMHYRADYTDAVATLRRLPQGFLVIDTIQGSLGHADYDASKDGAARHAINRRVLDLIDLTDAGYAVLVVSHITRGFYNTCPTLAAFKESGALEQCTWVAAGYWMQAGERRLKIIKARVPVPKGYEGAVLRLAADDNERLSEVGLIEAGKTARRERGKPAAPKPVQTVIRAFGDHNERSTEQVHAALARLHVRKSRRTIERWLDQAVEVGVLTKPTRGRYVRHQEDPAAAA
jgi:hypothetical protein